MYFLRAATSSSTAGRTMTQAKAANKAANKAATVLASVPVLLLSANGVFAQALPDLTDSPATEDAPALVRPVATPVPTVNPLPQIDRQRIPLSPGDRLRVTIPGIGGEEFSGEYEVNFSGALEIPFLEPVPVLGLVPREVEARLRDRLLAEQLFLPGQLRISVQVLDYAPVQVAVTGQVFEPGRILLSQESLVSVDAQGVNAEGDTVALPGDYPVERYLTSALKAIGGVRPNADVSRVQVLRGTESVVVDLSGIFTGTGVTDFPLIAGDQIIIPNSGVFQAGLIKPSQITPDSVDLFVSNVTQPGGNSSLEGNSDVNVASFEYGTNLTQALVAARCVGGTPSTNANRRALLIQSDTQTGGVITSEYNIPDLIDGVSRAEIENPFLMPDDAIACYDSRNTNIRGILGTVVDFINPLNLLINLFDND